MNTDNIDKFGHCVICHRNLITKRVVDGKVIDMFVPEHDHADFLLNNGSMMKVCCCKICKNTYDLKDKDLQEEIIEACQKGWELETKILVADEKIPEWTQEHADKYLSDMGKLEIDCHAENIDKNALVVKSQELTKTFSKENKIEVADGVNLDS